MTSVTAQRIGRVMAGLEDLHAIAADALGTEEPGDLERVLLDQLLSGLADLIADVPREEHCGDHVSGS
ncbi:hypothetical protein B2G71_20900 [Novosphingobium sp. PC22D]|uniref:hypothetical protein n=1 Tax=Novosphingobium sp. PC22D TaxID=1962403 RepID=UPI000BF0DC17|nr:hypothetical protein [Novosphingobium sp. PC22D]PEQ10765.1 hypothetical protein B2G71_20900 [Novosphingobium sp. PC22D]